MNNKLIYKTHHMSVSQCLKSLIKRNHAVKGESVSIFRGILFHPSFASPHSEQGGKCNNPY